MKSSDAYLVQILDTLEQQDLLDNTLVICTADHGEMGIAHGGLRQKNFNFYEETLRVPLVFSNPTLFPKAKTVDALVSHVDFLPTLAALFGAPPPPRADWQGVDYSELSSTRRRRPPQDYTVFTYDDCQSGQAAARPIRTAPNHIVSIREQRYKLAKLLRRRRQRRTSGRCTTSRRPAGAHQPRLQGTSARPRRSASQAAAAQARPRRETRLQPLA